MTDRSAARLSVVIACYNGAATLPEQLTALAEQTCPVPWELIVADNGSTDASVATAYGYADRLPLRVVDASGRRGPGHARNVGVDAAVGDWIAFCDADDVVAPDWLARVCAALARHPFVAGRVDVNLLNSPSVARARRMEQQTGLQAASRNRLGLAHAGAGNMALHRCVFQGVGGFDEGLTCLEDTDLCWRIQLAGTPLTFDPDLLLHTRLRPTVRGNYRQGRAYAVGQAGLEARYGSLSPSGAPDPAGAAAGRPAGRGSWSARLTSSAQDILGARSIDGLVWQLGWYTERALGRRRRADQVDAGPPGGAKVPLPPAPDTAGDGTSR